MDGVTCSACGLVIYEGDNQGDTTSCPRCGAGLEHVSAQSDAQAAGGGSGGGEGGQPDADVPEAREPETFPLEFTGNAKEYFRIWIVNMCLTVLTLGIYAAWARVRTRRYFYSNMRIGGHPFHFFGLPSAILRGNIIIGAGALIYTLAEKFSPVYAGVLVVLFYITLPFFIYKSIMFNTRYSAFRNIRFAFRGTMGQSYKVFLLFPLLVPVTFAVIVPYLEFLRKQYFFDNLGFGTADARFTGRPGFFYVTFVRAGLVSLALFLLLILLTGLWSPFAGLSRATFPFQIIAVWLLFLGAFACIQQYLYARLTNYCWGQTTIQGVSFQSTLSAGRLAWIRITNILAIIVTAGLLIPWAKIRRTRYFAENFTVTTQEGLESFAATAESDVSAVGDAATDFFDIGFGL